MYLFPLVRDLYRSRYKANDDQLQNFCHMARAEPFLLVVYSS